MRLLSLISFLVFPFSLIFAGMHVVIEPMSSFSDFIFVQNDDYNFRFLQFTPSTIDDSDYLLIEDLVLLQEGISWCIGNYQAIRSSDGTLGDGGVFMIDVPGLVSTEEVVSPVVGIVPGAVNGESDEVISISDSTIAYAEGVAETFEGNLSISARKGWSYVSGDIAYDVVDENTLALEACTLFYQGQSYSFLPMTLSLEKGVLTGLLVSADELNDYESVLFKITLSELFDGDQDGVYDLFDETPGSCDYETIFSDCPSPRKYSLFGLISDEYFYASDVGYMYTYENHSWYWVFAGAQLNGAGMYLWSWKDSAYLWTNKQFYPYSWNFSTCSWQLF